MRKIIHCDADCFYAAVEMRDNPSLCDKPIAVGGKAEGRGVIATCNYPARQFGIHSAMPSRSALKLCPSLILIAPRMAAYREASAQMREIFLDYTELIEPLSLDEAYLDVSNTKQQQGSATLIAQEIRARIKNTVGITVSAGIAPNKMLAKIASDWHKPDGQMVITPSQINDFIKPLSVKKIHGVGKALAEKLTQLNVHTCQDLQALSVFELSRRFGQMGQRLYDLSRGIDHRPVNPSRIRKSLSVENTFVKDLPDLTHCLAELPALMEQLTTRLSRLGEDYLIKNIFVKVKFSDFTSTTIERTGNQPDLMRYQHLLSEALQRRNLPVRLLGLGVSFNHQLSMHDSQLRLFSE